MKRTTINWREIGKDPDPIPGIYPALDFAGWICEAEYYGANGWSPLPTHFALPQDIKTEDVE